MKWRNKKILSVLLLLLFNFLLIFGVLLSNISLNISSPLNNKSLLIDPPESKVLLNTNSGLYEGTGITQANLTYTLDGTVEGDENGFSIPASGCNSTFVNATISNVTLYDYLYPIEEDFVDNPLTYFNFRKQVNLERWVMGFNVTDSCKLDAVDFVYTTGLLVDTTITGVIIYNATYNPEHFAIEPDQIIYFENESGLQFGIIPLLDWVSESSVPYWDGSLTIKPDLDISKTYKNLFFISFNASETLYWHYEDDAPNDDQGIVYELDGENWESRSLDFTLRLSLSPIIDEVEPSGINMTINSKQITELGQWNSTEFLISNASGIIPLNVSSTWYNILYTVNWTTYLQNVTSAKTSFSAKPLNETVVWNVTIPAVFVPDSYNRIINVTISNTWNATKVNNGSIEYSNWYESVINQRKSVIIQDIDSGTWVVICNGHNWISSITVDKEEIYNLDTINVNADLIHPVSNEIETAQLDVIDSLQNVIDSFTGEGVASVINFVWDISQSIYTHGNYQLLVTWFNGTDTGVWNTSIQIYNATSLLIVYPQHIGNIIERSRGSIFDLILYYNMSFWDGSWGTLYLEDTMGANVTYSFMGSAPQAMTKQEWLGHLGWNTQLTAPESAGDYPIYINSTAWENVQNYTNYLIILRVSQYESKLIFNDTAKEAFWNKSIAFSFTYSNLTGFPIEADNITIDWKYNFDSTYRGKLIEGLNYSITYNGGIGVYTIIFANFSAHNYNLKFYINAESYQPQEAYLNLIFNNRTTTLTNQTTIPPILYQENGLVNVTVYYEDLVNNQGISEGLIQSNWSVIKDYSVQELGGGYYNISLDVSGVSLNNYSILVNASKRYYENANLIIHLEIYGYSTNIESLTAVNLTGRYAVIYAMENWTFLFKYTNASNGMGIVNATISASFGGQSCVWQGDIDGNYTIWADSRKLSSPMAGQNYTLQISIGKTFYETQSFIIIINITELPSQLFPIKASIEAEVDDFVLVQVQLNDTYNFRGINGLVWYEIKGKVYQMVPSETEGLYYTILNLTNYTPDVYQIYITSWAAEYQNASTNITLNVKYIEYNLILRGPSHVNGGGILLILADLSNGTHYIGDALINFTITVVLQGNLIEVYYLSNWTASNGTAYILYQVPSAAITIYIIASYQRDGGALINSDTKIVVAINDWLFTLENWFFLVIILLLMGYIFIFGLIVYRKKLRPKLMSVESKKRSLIERRAENRRDIALVTKEIRSVRSETLKEAEIASKNMNFKKAAKLYKKAGNLTLELADKNIAREFFLKSKQMQKKSEQSKSQQELKERREKYLEKARIAIRERDVIKASYSYQQVAEISRMLGEREQANKFLKLANAAHERIEALKEGKLRKESGIFLSKADKAMGEQDFIEAFKNFEEAAKIMVILEDEDGANRLAGWAKLARERDVLANGKVREKWTEDLIQKQKLLISNAKGLMKEKNYEEAIKQYTTLVVYALELGKEDQVEKYQNDIEYCRSQASITEISPEMLSLINERKKLLLDVEDAIINNRFAVAAKYYNRIAAISEIVDGKEVARSYKKQANYYLNKSRKIRDLEKIKIEEKEIKKPPMKISEDEIEETKVELALTVKSARDALKRGKNILARELYEKSSILAGVVKDKDAEKRYRQKAEEVKILKPVKTIENEATIRKDITELVQKAEKAIQKKKFKDAKDFFEEISELFLLIDEEEAANEFLKRANSVRRLIQ